MTEASKKLTELQDVWQYSYDIVDRINADMRTISNYIEKRLIHEELSHDRDADPMSIKLADNKRTAAHNAAIRATQDLNLIATAAHLEPIGPVCENPDHIYLPLHRNAVARFCADVLNLDTETRAKLKL